MFLFFVIVALEHKTIQRCVHHLKAEFIRFPSMYVWTIFENLESEGAKNKITFKVVLSNAYY